MTMLRKILYWFCVMMLALCAGVFAWTSTIVRAVQSSEFQVPIPMEAGATRTKDFSVHYSGMYELALRFTKRDNGKPTMDAKRLSGLSISKNVDVHFTLTCGDSEIFSASTLDSTGWGSTDTHYYLDVKAVSLARGEKYRLRATAQTTIPELAPAQPSLSLKFSPVANKSMNVLTSILRYLSLRAGMLFSIAVFVPLLWRFIQRGRATQPKD